jgi:hypothetical protein
LLDLFEPWVVKMSNTNAEQLQNIDATQISNAARARLETLVRLYYLRHSYKMHDTLLMTHLLLVGSIALRSLPPITFQSNMSTMSLCYMGLLGLSQNDYLSILYAQILQNSVDPAYDVVSQEFNRIQSRCDSVGFKPEYVHSEWPVYQWIDSSNEKLGRLVKALDELSMQSSDISSREPTP